MEKKSLLSVLVVDDEEMLRDLIVSEFETKGFEAYRASSGQEALELLQAHPHISLILSDIRMPRMDGIELLNQIRAIHPDVPFVMLMTGYSDHEADNIYALGASALFEKPFNRAHLFETISRLLTPNSLKWTKKSEFQLPPNSVSMDVDFNALSLGRGVV